MSMETNVELIPLCQGWRETSRDEKHIYFERKKKP